MTKVDGITYEQCPWNREHVSAIYRNLGGNIDESGSWRDFPPRAKGIGIYRVYKMSRFQAIFARRPSALYQAAQTLDPVDSEADAEWEIRGSDGRYWVTTSFASVPGPFAHQEHVNAWLDRHALYLQNRRSFVHGVAFFTELTSGCLTDAMHRLTWLELAIRDVIKAIEAASESAWQQHEQCSDEITARVIDQLPQDEIIPVPDTGPITPRARIPVRAKSNVSEVLSGLIQIESTTCDGPANE